MNITWSSELSTVAIAFLWYVDALPSLLNWNFVFFQMMLNCIMCSISISCCRMIWIWKNRPFCLGIREWCDWEKTMWCTQNISLYLPIWGSICSLYWIECFLLFIWSRTVRDIRVILELGNSPSLASDSIILKTSDFRFDFWLFYCSPNQNLLYRKFSNWIYICTNTTCYVNHHLWLALHTSQHYR